MAFDLPREIVMTREFMMLASMMLLVNMLGVLVISLRYRRVLNKVSGADLSIKNAFYITCASQFAVFISPFKTGAIVTKPVLTAQTTDANTKNALLSTLVEQTTELFWQIIILIPLMAIAGFGVSGDIYMFVSAAVIAAFLAYSLRKKLLGLFVGVVDKVYKVRGKTLDMDKEELQKYVKGILRDRRFFRDLLLYNIAIMFVNAFFMYIAVIAAGARVQYIGAFVIYWISKIIGRISGLPGGFGSTDLTLLGLMNLYGVGAVALNTVIIYRLFGTLPFFVLGGPILGYYGAKASKETYQRFKAQRALRNGLASESP